MANPTGAGGGFNFGEAWKKVQANVDKLAKDAQGKWNEFRTSFGSKADEVAGQARAEQVAGAAQETINEAVAGAAEEVSAATNGRNPIKQLRAGLQHGAEAINKFYHNGNVEGPISKTKVGLTVAAGLTAAGVAYAAHRASQQQQQVEQEAAAAR